MYQTLGDRISYIQKLVGSKPLQEAANISQSTLSRLCNDQTLPTSTVLVALAKNAGVSVNWLATGEGEPTNDSPNGYVKIKPLEGDQRSQVLLDVELLRQRNIDPENCAFVSVDGDAMQGSFPAGMQVVIELGQSKQDGIYAVRMQGTVTIRRLQFAPNGDLKILSDNPSYPDYTLKPEEQSSFEIIGHRIWHGGF